MLFRSVATTAAVSKQYEQGNRSDGDTDSGYEPKGSGDGERGTLGEISEGERKSDKSVSNDSTKSDSALDDVAEYEIPWDEMVLGDRIGLGINFVLFLRFVYIFWKILWKCILYTI